MSAVISRIGEQARFHSLALIVCALFLVAGLAMVDDHGVPWHTDTQRFIAIGTVNAVLHDVQALLQINFNNADRFYGTAFELPLLLLTERVLGLEDPRHVYLARHVLTHLFFLIGGFCCYLLALRLCGDRLVALLVMLLFLLSPRLYAHSFFNSKDPVFASAFVMALLLVSRVFDKDSVGAYRWGGMAVGLLIHLRIMGAVLFAVVLVFRAWAWFRAEGRAARRRATATIGVFALWGGLVLFISLPYLWGDPVGRLAEYWLVLADHPFIRTGELFRGQAFSGAALPWDYLPRWFAISQPPVTLLLGLLGLGALPLRAPGQAQHGGGELRFGVLLAACFALPLVAFALLQPATYDGWRHFYFLHGPFCLLATFALMGLRQLPVRGLRKRQWLGGAAGALTAAGLGVVVVEMAQIHPNQHLYFNFLADRKTPERLQTRYTMDYYFLTLKQGYEYTLRQTPSRRPLPTHDPSRDPDFYLAGREVDLWLSHLPDDPFPPVLHRIKVYNNTIWSVSTPDLSRVDPAVADEYRALHRAVTAGTPAARAGGYEVYLHGKRLAWVKKACEPGALRREFQLKLYPANAYRLPDHHRKRGYFELSARGVRFDGKCLATARLPDFALTWVHLGQRGGWEVEVPL